MKRLFTPMEAECTLPLVRRIVADILANGREIRRLSGRRDPDKAHIFRLETTLKRNLKELDQIGCSYKDNGYEVGLVDFPSDIEGKPVLLCWRSDEERVEWYHGFEEGYSARKRIPTELLASQPSPQA